MKWICERSAELDPPQGANGFKTQEDFLQFLDQAVQVAPDVIALLANDLLATEESVREWLSFTRTRLQANQQLDAEMLITAACAWDLARSPTLETWRKVRRISRHSWQIEHWLKEAMSAYAQRDDNARKAYVELAVQLFKALENRELDSESDRKNEARNGAWEHWQAAKYPLEEIWWGLRGSDFMNYEEEMHIFGLLNEIEHEGFLRLISSSSNPFLVDAALLSSGVGPFNPRFAQWEKFAQVAPLAFTQDGSWVKGSVLLPLLLVQARHNLHAPSNQTLRYGADEADAAALTSQVLELVRAVVNILANRGDAPALFARWSTWLMRQVLQTRDMEFNDIRSRDFVDKALIEEMGRAMQGLQQITAAPEVAAPWEAWCYLCVKSMFADSGLIKMPSFDEFACQWKITPENWYGLEGRGLLERADLHLPRDNIPDLSANLLVLSLAENDEFALGWHQLWDNAYYLREVLEFGSIDAGTKTYSDRADASRLLLLLACMGLACFDQATCRLTGETESLAKELACLYRVLALAAMEVLLIDDTISRDKWKTLLQHLAVRRVYWDGSYTTGNQVSLFTENHEPAIRHYLDYFKADPSDLVAFLSACMFNQLDASKIREELRSAGVDLSACVNTLQRLHELSEYKYPIQSGAIRAIEPLM